MPINIGNFNTATALLNYTPGINNGSAFGGDSGYGNALLIDGVDTRDPEAGSAWVFYNFNIIEEVQVGGLGAAGRVRRLLGRGGQHDHQVGRQRATGASSKGGTRTRASPARTSPTNYLKLNPALGDANVLKKLTDYTVQLGGPISEGQGLLVGQRPAVPFEQDPAGPRTMRTEVSPRYNGKLTFNLTPNDTLIGSVQYDNYNVTGRAGLSGRHALERRADGASRTRPKRSGTSSTARCSARARSSRRSTPATGATTTSTRSTSRRSIIDNDTGEYSGGAGYYYYADRGRNQANVSLSKYAEAFGTHNFKFGIEIERSTSHSRSEYSSCGAIGACYVVQYSGVPYLRVQRPELRRQRQEQARVVLRAGRVEEGTADGQSGPPAGPHPWRQPVPEQERLRAGTRGRPAHRRRVRPDRQPAAASSAASGAGISRARRSARSPMRSAASRTSSPTRSSAASTWSSTAAAR